MDYNKLTIRNDLEDSNTKNKLEQRKIGTDSVPAIGIGLMGMSAFYLNKDNPEDKEKTNMEVLTLAADMGETFWDTSDVYGPFSNEELIGRWFKKTGRRNEIFLATKFALIIDPITKAFSVRGDAEYVQQSVEGSLKRLGIDQIDLYYQHRVDLKVPIEETVGAMANLVKQGKVKYLGLSECSAATLRRAHKIYPISAVQVEYSLFSLDIEKVENGIKKACEELNIAIIAYSPLGRGMLTGQYKSRKDFIEGDSRLNFPRFSSENFSKNLDLVDKIIKIANKKGCTAGQLSLAWLLKQGNNVIPIPGTKQLKYLKENLGALDVDLSSEEIKEIRDFAEKIEVQGNRYMAIHTALLFADSI